MRSYTQLVLMATLAPFAFDVRRRAVRTYQSRHGTPKQQEKQKEQYDQHDRRRNDRRSDCAGCPDGIHNKSELKFYTLRS